MIWLLICLVIKKFKSTVTALFVRGRKLIIYFAFITQSYFKVSKDATLNTKYFFIMKTPSKKELQQLCMTTDDKIRDERLQYINREAAKISALTSGKIDKYEYVKGWRNTTF